MTKLRMAPRGVEMKALLLAQLPGRPGRKETASGALRLAAVGAPPAHDIDQKNAERLNEEWLEVTRYLNMEPIEAHQKESIRKTAA